MRRCDVGTSPADGPGEFLACARPAGHEGHHVANDPAGVQAVADRAAQAHIDRIEVGGYVNYTLED